MKAIRSRFTYANVMSSIAVFLVLGGATAFAASHLGKNSVGAKQLKKNSVTAAKIKGNAITATKIKDGAVGGAKIDESSLGTVPSATSAANAAVAANLAGYTHNSVRLTPTPVSGFNDGRDNAPETVVAAVGPLSVDAKCFSYGGTVYGMFLLKSAVGGSIFDSYSDSTYGNVFLNPDTFPENRELFYQSAGGNYAYFDANQKDFEAMAPGGPTVQGNLQVGVKQGTLTGSQGIYGPGDVCLMGAQLFTV